MGDLIEFLYKITVVGAVAIGILFIVPILFSAGAELWIRVGAFIIVFVGTFVVKAILELTEKKRLGRRAELKFS